MENKNSFTTSFVVNQSPAAVFNAINNVRNWWQGEITGLTNKLGEEFSYRMKDVHYSKQKISTLLPNKKVEWLVIESNISFVADTKEWEGTTITFDLEEQENGTKLTFTHHGLVPMIACYEGCSNGWTALIEKSLYSLITTGKGVDVF